MKIGVDLRGGQVWPCLVELHTHLDKGHIWPRAANPDGSFMGAVTGTLADRAVNWSAADVERRFAFGLACAYAHGTAAIRTHIDSYETQAETSWAVFRTLRERWAGRIDLQAASIAPIDTFGTAFGVTLADLVARSGGILGCVTRLSGEDHEAIPQAFHDLLTLFVEYASDDALALMPGHYYFLAQDDEADRKLFTELRPLLEEYLAQGYVAGFADAMRAWLDLNVRAV